MVSDEIGKSKVVWRVVLSKVETATRPTNKIAKAIFLLPDFVVGALADQQQKQHRRGCPVKNYVAPDKHCRHKVAELIQGFIREQRDQNRNEKPGLGKR